MLIYHPVHDVNHCVYRTLLVLETTAHSDIDLDLFRLIDFYHLFPNVLKEIKPFPSELRTFRKIIRNIPEPYELIGNIKRTMYELEAIQTTAIQNLMAKNLINIPSYRAKSLKRTEEVLPEQIYAKIQNSSIAKEEWFRMLINDFPTMNLFGKKGLKARSGLMEFRYDVETL